MQVKRDITGGIMSVGVIVTSVFAIMRSNLTEVNMNEVAIIENGERITIATEAETVRDLITDGYVQIGNFDDFCVEMEDYVYDGMEIEITRATPVVINDGGARFQIMTTESDAVKVLNQHEIELGNDDLLEIVVTSTNALGEEVQISPAILPGIEGSVVEIEITRVSFETVITTNEITLETEYIYTNELRRGERETRVSGEPKVTENIIESLYHNGEFYAIVNDETNVIYEGVARVVAIGTYVPAPPPVRVNTTPPTDSLETFTANVTAFQANCRGCSGITANGTDVRSTTTFNDATFGTVRIIAADRRFPFGSIIYISGVGNAVVLDRGGSVRGNVLDLLKGANDNPLQFGRQFLQAQVVRLGW